MNMESIMKKCKYVVPADLNQTMLELIAVELGVIAWSVICKKHLVYLLLL